MAPSYLADHSTKETVESITLDDYVRQHNIVKVEFIKMDIEGGEINALKGMNQVLLKMKPILLLEVNDIALKNANHSEAEILALLKSRGYAKIKELSRNENSYNAVFQYIQ